MKTTRANRAALAMARGLELFDVRDEDLRAAASELRDRDFCEVYGCANRHRRELADAVREGRQAEIEVEVRTGSGGPARPRPCRVRVFAKGESAGEDDKLGEGRLVMVEDVTMARRREAERARTHQLEAVALLAATLSHEINQPLGSILGRAQLGLLTLDEEEPDPGELKRGLKEIVDGVGRVKKILEKLHKVADIVKKPYVGDSEILDLEKSAER
jgi:signal transduction histidine kinase